MGYISFDTIPIDLRTPGQFVEISNARAVQGLVGIPTKILVLGQKLASVNLPVSNPVRITSADQAADLFGRGSMLHMMFVALKANNRFTESWAYVLADDEAAQAATGAVTFSAAATAAGTLEFYVGGPRPVGRKVRIGVAAAEATTALATKLAAAINADPDLPVTAAVDVGNTSKVRVEATMKALAIGATVVGGLVVANKAVGLTRSTIDTFRYIRGGKGKGGAANLAGAAGAFAGGAGGAVPVVVTNWPGAGAAGLAGSAADVTGNAGGKGKVNAKGLRGIASRAGRWLGRGAGVLGGVLGAVDAVGSFMDGDTRGAVGAVGRTVGGIGGGALGSLLGPVGTVAGGAGGAWGGEKLFTALYDYFAGNKDQAKEIKGGLEITVRSENGTTAQVTGLSSQTPGFELDVGRIAAGG